MSDPKKDVKELETALPGVLEKIKKLHASLNPEEKAILQEIVDSAASEAVHLSGHAEGHKDIKFAKSMSVHGSANIRQGYINLAKELSKDPKK